MLTKNQELLVHWITERWSILKKREAGQPKPWTEDKILQSEYFCNVNREDDKVTKWIRANWKHGPIENDELNNGEPCTGKTFAAAITAARLFNLPATLAEFRQPVDNCFEVWLEHLQNVVDDRKFEELKVWNGAYIVSTHGKKMDKGAYCIQIIKDVYNAWKDTIGELRFSDPILLHKAHQELMKVHGISSFMAAQIIADLKNTEGHPFFHARDKWDFCASGPGSLRGLSWFFETKITNKDFSACIVEAYQAIEFELEDDIIEILDMQNLQNCFCEYDKYMRVLNEVGRSKRHYNGRT